MYWLTCENGVVCNFARYCLISTTTYMRNAKDTRVEKDNKAHGRSPPATHPLYMENVK